MLIEIVFIDSEWYWFIVSYDSANSQKHYKKPSHAR